MKEFNNLETAILNPEIRAARSENLVDQIEVAEEALVSLIENASQIFAELSQGPETDKEKFQDQIKQFMQNFNKVSTLVPIAKNNSFHEIPQELESYNERMDLELANMKTKAMIASIDRALDKLTDPKDDQNETDQQNKL
ncbi:MAG: hypothetical protein EZS28_020389 [Streblomastix strix]|uniref:Uncharacterized protein n=1 Tax=Streblomastix strix TaxID=222440 RepID=A0A5J4VNP7_9EUKA|nr:MAG: hypothetical protein EZS28_020389 [Streblomastix strix]